MTKDETIEPSLAENNGLTPSKHGFSAALRAQVIEECAKVAEEQARYFLSPQYATDQPLSSFNERFACKQVAASIRSLSAVSAIAQERDVGKPVAWRWKWVDGQTWMFSASEPDDDGLREIQPLYLHPTTSPKAIGEEPSSSEAVNTTPQSIEVGEMVERHGFTLTWYPEVGSYRVSKPNIGTMDVVPASLLIALDAERGRLREALSDLVKMHDLDDPYDAEHVKLFNLVIERARSALPASDEG